MERVRHRLARRIEVRIVQCLRSNPTATLAETSRRVGISVRTLTRKYSFLIEQSIVWFEPLFDFRAVANSVVVLDAILHKGAEPAGITRRLRSRFPLLLELASTAGAPETKFELFEWAVVLPTSSRIDDLQRFASSLTELTAWIGKSLFELTISPTGLTADSRISASLGWADSAASLPAEVSSLSPAQSSVL